MKNIELVFAEVAPQTIVVQPLALVVGSLAAEGTKCLLREGCYKAVVNVLESRHLKGVMSFGAEA